MSRGFQRGFMHFAENCKIPRLEDQIISLADELENNRDIDIKHMVKAGSKKPDGLSPKKSMEKVAAQFSLTERDLQDIDNLLDFSKFNCVEDAMSWLLTEGFKANREYLDRMEEVRKQIDGLKDAL
ncbi:MAG: hypothetical protein U9N44_02655 [Chloroflexota bacterium]|nr:hypothetical protein [Chloroflexota bacterium]